MRKRQAELRPAAALLLSCIATCRASLFRQQGTSDAPLSSAASARAATAGGAAAASSASAATLRAAFEGLRREAEGRRLEDALHLYERGQRLANLSGVSTEEKGLMLLQEAVKTSDPTLYEKAVGFHAKLKEWAKKQWFKKNDMYSCYNSYLNMPLNLLGGFFSIFVAVRCDSTGNCLSEGFETLRYFLVATQFLEGSKSYCAEDFHMGHLCKAAAAEVASNAAGLTSVGMGLTYKCPEYAGGDADKIIAGLKVSDIKCGLGYGKGATYMAAAVYRLADIYFEWAEITAREGQGPIAFYTGQNKTHLFAQVGAILSWMVQLVLLSVGNCKEEAGGLACGGEIAELLAYVAQTITSALMVNSYCLGPDSRKAALDGGRPVPVGRRPLLQKDTDANENAIVSDQNLEDNPGTKPKTGDSDDLAQSTLDDDADSKKITDVGGGQTDDEDAIRGVMNNERIQDAVNTVMDDERVQGVVNTVMNDGRLSDALGSVLSDDKLKDTVSSVMDSGKVNEVVDTLMKDKGLSKKLGWMQKLAKNKWVQKVAAKYATKKLV